MIKSPCPEEAFCFQQCNLLKTEHSSLHPKKYVHLQLKVLQNNICFILIIWRYYSSRNVNEKEKEMLLIILRVVVSENEQ